MLLKDQISQSLASLKGLAAAVPKTVGWTAESGPRVEADFLVVDTLSCSFRELRLTADELDAAPFEAFKTWAENLCKRVTYLLEHIGPLELDAEAQTVMIRSTPPTREPNATAFYEMLLQAPGNLSLRRYIRTPGSDERQQADMQATHEVLQKLVQDIVEAIPALAEDD